MFKDGVGVLCGGAPMFKDGVGVPCGGAPTFKGVM